MFPVASSFFSSLWNNINSGTEMVADPAAWLGVGYQLLPNSGFLGDYWLQTSSSWSPKWDQLLHFSPCIFINPCVPCGKGKTRFTESERERLQSRACSCTFVLSQQPLLNVSLAQNRQFNLATILFSGVHDSSLYLSWQSEQLNFPEW